MHDLISANKLNLLEKHVFQFDFLNDPFDKLPQPLRNIINDEERRKKLVIYINPPYAEAANKRTVTGNGENKTNVAIRHLTYHRFISEIGIAGRELFAQFFIRIYHEIPSSVQAPNFRDFRKTFRAKLGRNFLVPAKTFDNVKGKFPIGFFIWHLSQSEEFKETISDVYDEKGDLQGTKTIFVNTNFKSINDWIISTRNKINEIPIGYMATFGCDFQHSNYNYIINDKNQLPHPRGTWVTNKNLKEIAVYFAVRHCISSTWLNDRDQFLYPLDSWRNDAEFQTNCLAYTLFTNDIQSEQGTNHWIPFTEQEVGAQEKFASHFMADYISGKNRPMEGSQPDIFSQSTQPSEQDQPLVFSPEEATAVIDAGRELWRYYHAQPEANANAAFYDIRLYFQGRNDKGKMNNNSTDRHYTELLNSLRQNLRLLAQKIEPKIYEHGFLLR